MLGLEIPIAILGAMHSLYASGGLVGFLKGDVDSKRLVLTIGTLAIADGYLLDIAVLAEEFWFS